ncbi:MPN499 family protein [[Mycoplasma] collis]|uniref:MPN499 family protein n=1 Tax=[Mycoplasma] collis TaxID=2127 RepID=UPI00051B3746|nr:hypothetical protein [[Mycoplasma] collis]
MPKIIKINHNNDGFWILPSFLSIFSKSIKASTMQKFHTLDTLIAKTEIYKKEAILSFNGDEDFSKFNKCLKYRKINFTINYNNWVKLDKNAIITFNINENIKVHLDFKGFRLLYQGRIPFYSLEWYKKYYDKNKKFIDKDNILNIKWTYLGWDLL